MKLVKALAAVVLVSCAALACGADGDPPAVIGRLSYISGPVSFAPAQADEDWVAASLNRPITTGDRLWTDAGGRAELHVGSLALRMDSQTSLDVLNLDERALQLRLAQGSASVRVRRATGGESVEIATPGGAVVLSRPGSYRVSVDPQGYATSVAVRGGGQAEVFAPNGSFVVRDGQQATLSGSREDVAIAPAPDEFDRWAAQRDTREEQVAATRYVSAEMTGYEDLDEYGTWRTVLEYGTVWQPTAVPAGWAPYRYGHWVWIAPWGWTWVDDEPWGFAPSHYGRWIWLGQSWAWAPGRIVARPVYAPALVAFIGGPDFSVSIGARSAPAVGWVPLGWHEPYRPWYRASRAHVHEVNVTDVTNVTNITNFTNVRYRNRSAPSGVTVVSRENFAAARPVQRAVLRVAPGTVAAAPVTAGSPVATPSTASLAQARQGARPPAEIKRREAVAVSAPPRAPVRTALRDSADNRLHAKPAPDDEHPRVRVIDRRERVNSAQAEGQRAAEKQARTAPPAAAAAPERAPEKAEARPREAEQRRVPAPPATATTRPTFDRSGRVQEAPQREQPAGRERQLAEYERQRLADREQAQGQADTRQQQEEREQAQRQQQAQQRAREQAEQRAQQQPQRQSQPQAREQQAREREPAQRAEQQARQRAQEQAAHEQERQAQQRAQVEARQREQAQHAEQQARQRAQQQTEQRAARQQAEHQAQQRAQQQARLEQAQRAEQQAQQRAQQQAQQQQSQQHAQQQAQEQARQQRRSESQEKGGRERPRAEKSEKG